MIKEAIEKLMQAENLTYDQVKESVDEIMTGQASPALIASFLTALSIKGETDEEIAGAAESMRSKALPLDSDGDILDIVGTGGDKSGSFNISTTASIVIAAGGQPVAKHGNRAASSKSCAADCLEALGVNLNQTPETCVQELKDVGLCFFFAQKYHTSMKYVGAIRKELGFRTIFNILGPITNPCKPCYQVLGVYGEYLVEPMAHVLSSLGVERGMVVFGQDTMDEISISAPTTVCEFGNGEYKSYTIQPEDFGFPRGSKSDIVGGTGEENAQITRDILSGKEQGAKRNIVLMNAGAALYISGKADTLADGVKLAAELVDSGKAMQTLEAYVAASNK